MSGAHFLHPRCDKGPCANVFLQSAKGPVQMGPVRHNRYMEARSWNPITREEQAEASEVQGLP